MSPEPGRGADGPGGSIFATLRALSAEPEEAPPAPAPPPPPPAPPPAAAPPAPAPVPAAPPAAAPVHQSPGPESQALLKKMEQIEARLSQPRGDDPAQRIVVLERQLREAQERAIAATVMLREREEAQRAARRETEAILHSLSANRRSEELDRQMREQLSAHRRRIEELEAKLLAAASAPSARQDQLAAAQNMMAAQLEGCQGLLAALSRSIDDVRTIAERAHAAAQNGAAQTQADLRAELHKELAAVRSRLEEALNLLRKKPGSDGS